MSKAIEQEIADYLITNLNGLVPVRVSEQADRLPESDYISVHLEQQTLRIPNVTNIFDHRVRVLLRMHYADKTSAQVDEASDVIMNALVEPTLKDTLNAYEVKLMDTRSTTLENYWEREFNLEILRVDMAS